MKVIQSNLKAYLCSIGDGPGRPAENVFLSQSAEDANQDIQTLDIFVSNL